MSQQFEIDHWTCLSEVSGVDALLRRGDLKCTLRVVPGNTTTETDGGGGVVYTSRSADFLFRLSEVLVTGECTELQAMDRLEVFGNEYEILPADGERHFDPSGNYNILGRMHTKYIGPVKTKQRYVRDVNEEYARDENGQYVGDQHADAS